MPYGKRAPLGRTPDRDVPKTVKKYVVTGPHEVFGHGRGEIVTLELTEAHAATLTDSGHIALWSAPAGEPAGAGP